MLRIKENKKWFWKNDIWIIGQSYEIVNIKLAFLLRNISNGIWHEPYTISWI